VKLSDIGPGLLLAATGIGVGDMVSSTIAGAEYGLTLIWALAAGVILKFAITEGAARWQLGTGNTLMEGWRDHLPRAAVLAFFLYFIVWSYFVSSALVAASALVPAAIIPSVPLPVWGFIHAVAAFTMVWFGRYERFLSVIKWFVGLKFGAVIGSVLLIIRGASKDAGDEAPFALLLGVLSLIAGLVVIRNPRESLVLLAVAFAVWAIVFGGVSLGRGLVRSHRRWVRLLRGVVLVTAGTVIISWPDISGEALTVLAGLTIILNGCVGLAEAAVLRALRAPRADG